MFMRQNGGRVSRKRRESEFTALTDDETKRIEAIYSEFFGDVGD